MHDRSTSTWVFGYDFEHFSAYVEKGNGLQVEYDDSKEVSPLQSAFTRRREIWVGRTASTLYTAFDSTCSTAITCSHI